MNNEKVQYPLLRILVIIVDANKIHEITDLLNRLKCNRQTQFHANGTATSEILDILGLGAMGKIVTVCVLPTAHVESVLQSLSEEFYIRLPGKGVAFTVPVSAISGRALALINNGTNTHTTESEVIDMEIDIHHHLIVATVNQGYSEGIVAAARNAGASGGTVWSARNVITESSTNPVSALVQGEREIVAILAEKTIKLEILKVLNEEFGVSSEAQGVILSLPVDHVAGLCKEKSNIE